MTVEITAKAVASNTLDELNTIIDQNEQVIGPLTGIGNEKALTTLTFQVGPSPAKRAILAADINGAPVVPAGSTVIDTDLVFVVGNLTLCTATRPA